MESILCEIQVAENSDEGGEDTPALLLLGDFYGGLSWVGHLSVAILDPFQTLHRLAGGKGS